MTNLTTISGGLETHDEQIERLCDELRKAVSEHGPSLTKATIIGCLEAVKADIIHEAKGITP